MICMFACPGNSAFLCLSMTMTEARSKKQEARSKKQEELEQEQRSLVLSSQFLNRLTTTLHAVPWSS